MNLTFKDEIIKIDGLPFNLNEQETINLLEIIPKEIHLTGLQIGFENVQFKEELFEYIVKNILHFESTNVYYESDVYEKYIEKGELLSNDILLGEPQRFKITFNAVFYKKDMNETQNFCGSFESVATSLDAAKKNAFFELAKIVFNKGNVVKKLEIVEIFKM